MAAEGPGAGRLPCPCRARRAERPLMAAAAFAVLQVIARWQRRRWSAYADWRTWPPGYDPWADGGEPVAGQHEGSAYRPGYGFLPARGHELSPRDPARLRVFLPGRSKRAEGAS